MNFAKVDRWYIVYDTSRGRDYTFKYEGHEKITEIKHDEEGVCGHPQINRALDEIDENSQAFIYVLDDDNVMHYNFWILLPTLDQNYIYTWDQNRSDSVRFLKGGVIQRGGIDTAQFIVPRHYIGSVRWNPKERQADGQFIVDIHKKHSDVFIYIPKIACFFNYLLAGSGA
jgi:hypothetical protein